MCQHRVVVTCMSGVSASSKLGHLSLLGPAMVSVAERCTLLQGCIVDCMGSCATPVPPRCHPRRHDKDGKTWEVPQVKDILIQFIIFDVIAIDGTLVCDRPLLERKALLNQIVKPCKQEDAQPFTKASE